MTANSYYLGLWRKL